MTATADPQPADQSPSSDNEQLRRMSLGEHLDEARRRLMISLMAVAICVFGMLPFKDQVTAIFLAPYQEMWTMVYVDWLAEEEAFFASAVGSKDLEERRAAQLFLDGVQPDGQTRLAWISAGRYPDEAEAQQRSGFAGKWVAKGQSGRDVFLRAFHEYGSQLVGQRDRLGRLQWHRLRKGEIFAGTYSTPDLIYSEGGFPLKKVLVSDGPLADFWTFMAAAMVFALMLASPVVLYQAWAFIAAGLYEKERRVVQRVLPFSLLLMAGGVCFCFFVMVPYGIYFLAKMMDWSQIGPLFTVSLYFKFLFTLTIALALVFQMPMVMVALQKVGILTFAGVAGNWRWVVLAMFVLSAALTPPDPVTQALMVGPMLGLFGLGLFLMWRGRGSEAPAAPKPEPSAES